MGINLWDIGAVATGAIERDREHTAENLKIRADELAAKRNALIQRKNKKYDAEIKSYYKEKGTMDKINSLNAEAASFNDANKDSGKTYDKDLYASRYLIATMGANDFNAMTDTQKKIAINNFQTTGANYTMQTKDPDKLAALQSKEENIILSNYADQLKNAKDDSFLINKILGKKTTVSSSEDLEKAVDTEVKASEIVTKIDNAENPDKADGTSIQLTETIKAFSPSKDWRKEYAKAFGDTKYDLKGDLVFNYLNTLGVHGGNDELSLKFNKTDSGIDGHNANSMTQVEFMNDMFTQLKNSKTTTVIGAITGPDNFEQIGTVLNTEEILSEMTSILDQGRSGNIKHDPWGRKGNVRLTTFVPLNVADAQGNLIVNGIKVGGLNEAQMKKVNGYLNDFILKQTELRKDKDIDAQGVAVGIYRKIFANKDANMLNSFNAYLLDKDKDLKASYEKALAASKEETDTTTEKTTTETTTTEGIDEPKANFTLGLNKDNQNSIVVPEDGAVPGWKKGDKIPLTKSNIKQLKTLNNSEINSLISEGIKFGLDVDTMAPSIGTPSKYLTTPGKRGVKQINPQWQKLQDLQKSLKKPKKSTKKKIR